jgi:hypothetical protein
VGKCKVQIGVNKFTKYVPRRDKRGFGVSSVVLPFGALWYTKPDDASDYAKFAADHMMLWFTFTMPLAT